MNKKLPIALALAAPMLVFMVASIVTAFTPDTNTVLTTNDEIIQYIQNSSQVKRYLDTNEISGVKVVHITEKRATVTTDGEWPYSKAIVFVDLMGGRIINILGLKILITTDGSCTTNEPVNDEEIGGIMDVLNRDPEAKAILDKGAKISSLCRNGMSIRGIYEDGISTGLTEEKKRIQLWLDLGNKRYEAHVQTKSTNKCFSDVQLIEARLLDFKELVY